MGYGMRFGNLLVWLALFLSGSSLAGVKFLPLDDATAFTIDGRAYSARAVSLLQGESRKHDPSVQPVQVVKGLVENRLLANNRTQLLGGDSDSYKGQHRDAEHEGHEADGEHSHGDHARQAEQGGHGNHAEYTHTIGINVQSQDEYQQLLNQIKRLAADIDLKPWIDKSVVLDRKKLTSLLSAEQIKMSREDLNETQIQGLKDMPVLGYVINKEKAVVTAWDVFSHSNVHQRVRIRRADDDALLTQALQHLLMRVQQQMIVDSTAWTEQDLGDLYLFVRDKVKKQADFKELGIISDLHHDAAALDSFKVTVSDKEIAEYYDANKNDFVQVGSVKARHITVATQEDADTVYEKIEAGMSFDDAIKKYSISADKNAPVPGYLGFINKNSPNLPFVHKLALIQPVGKPSTPYRMLDGNSYEILLIDEKTPEVIPVTDKSVRGEIRTRIAQQKASLHVERLQDALRANADIQINQRLYTNFTW